MSRNIFQFKFTILSLLINCYCIISTSYAQISEKKLGEQTFEIVKQTQGFYNHPQALQLVTEVGRDLEKHLNLQEPLSYHLVDVAEPNAFATAGGYVFVTRGLLALLNSRDELAGVMAHELSHVTEHHVKKQVSASLIPQVLELPGKLIGALTIKEIGDVINLPIELPSQVILKSYSRSQENEADRKGVDLTAKAGYDPYALSEILLRLDRYVEALTNEHMQGNLFMDHPLTSDRVSKLSSHLSKAGYKPKTYKAGTDLQALQDVIFGQNPAEGYIEGNKFFHTDLRLFAEFPEKWIIQNSPVSVTAVAPDKKSAIMVSMEHHSGAPRELAEKAFNTSTHKNSTIIKDTVINGLTGALAMITKQKSQATNRVTEILWLKMPESSVILKIAGVADSKNNLETISNSMGSFRSLLPADFTHVNYYKLMLRPNEEVRLLDTYIKSKGIQLINGFSEGETLPDGKYLKVIESYPLSGY